MKLVVYPTLAAAQSAQRAFDTAAGYPCVHAEGTGPNDYRIPTPGIAAASIRAAGVRTEHQYALVTSHDGTRFALVAADQPSATDIDPTSFFGPDPRGA